jgi:sulfofructose kinase
VDTIYPGFDAVLRNVDYLVAGSSWPEKWTGESDPFRALSRLQREYDFEVAAMTLGDRGSLALHEGRWSYAAAYNVSCADTTGAGDVFHGAFCYAMSRGMAMRDALEFSNAAAAINCTAIGARGHVPSLLEVETLMESARAGTVARLIDEDIRERTRAEVAPLAAATR